MTVAVVHLSDLHFAREPLPRISRVGGVVTTPGFALWGQRPHDPAVLDELYASLLKLRFVHDPNRTGCSEPWHKMILVISGDLTVIGDDSEFANALTALTGRLSVDATKLIDIASLFDEILMVPGNHDHFRGRAVLGAVYQTSPSPIHAKYFPMDRQSPAAQLWVRNVTDTQGVSIAIGGVDSTAGPSTTYFAQGTFPAGWDHDLARLFQSTNTSFRVLMTHHSWDAGSSLQGALHRFTPQAEAELVQFISDNGVDLLLTGHLHAPLVDPGTIERRCGTTLQSCSPTKTPCPLGWTFLVHEFDVSPAQRSITSTVYSRTILSGGFVRLHQANPDVHSPCVVQRP